MNCIFFLRNGCGFQVAGSLGGTKEKTKIKEEIKGKKWTKRSRAEPSRENKWKVKQKEEGN
jgi:hypothetical protein